MNVKKLDRDETLRLIDLYKTRIAFNNNLNKMARKYMKEVGLVGKFNSYQDAPSVEMQEILWNELNNQDWMDDELKADYRLHCGGIFGGTYGPHVNKYVLKDLHDLERHLEEIEKASQARTVTLNGLTIKRDLASNRLNLYFDCIPEREARELLKKHGFRWSPYLQAWTRQLTANAEKSLEYLLKEMVL